MAEQQYIYVAAPAVVASPASYAGYQGYSQTSDTAYVQPNYAFQVTEQSATGAGYALPSYQYEVQPATHYAPQAAGAAVSGPSSQQQVLAEYPLASAQHVYSNQTTPQVVGASSYPHQVASQQAVAAYGQQATGQQQQAASYNTGHLSATSLQQAAPAAASYSQQGAQVIQQQYGVTMAYPPHAALQQQQQVAQYAIQQQQAPGVQQQQIQQSGYAGAPVMAQQGNIAYAQQAIVPGQAAMVYATQQQLQQQPAYLQQQQQQQQLSLPQPQQQQQYGQQQQQQQQHAMMQSPPQQTQQQVMFAGHNNHQPPRAMTFPGHSMQAGGNSLKLGHQRNQPPQSPGGFAAGNMGVPSMPPSRGHPPPMPPSSSSMVGDMEVQKFPDTIFIQGLPDDTTEDMLVQHFSTFGKLKVDNRTGKPRVSLVKDKASGKPRGEATLGYQDTTSANNAIKLFNNKEFRGRKIRIEVASRKVIQGQQPQHLHATKRNRPGEDSQDWVCVNQMCNNQNFSWRTECNRCRAPKPNNPQLKSPLGMRLGAPAANAGNPGALITMPTNNNPHFNNHNNLLSRPPLLGNGMLHGNNPHHHNRHMLNHPANNMLGMRGPNIPGQSMRGRLGMGPMAGNLAAVASLNGGPIRPAVRGRMDRRLGRPY